MRARSLIAAVLCAFLLLILAQPVLGNISQAPAERELTEEEQLRAMNLNFETIGETGTYEEYMASWTDEPYRVQRISRAPPPDTTHASTVIVFVELTKYTLLTSELTTYTTDLTMNGYYPVVLTVSGGSAEDLKDTLLTYYTNDTYDLVGAILIGDLPTAWFYHANDFSGGATFPIDLFLMDMDGTWTDGNSDGKYESHTDGSGDTAPELFTGRIDADNVPGTPINVIKNYLGKVHKFWTGQINRSYKGLTYTDHDWASGPSFLHDISYAYSDYEALAWPAVERNDYMNTRVPNASYEFIQLSCHSGSSTHYFHTGGTASSTQIRTTGPEALFYNLYCCSGARFTDYNCLGNAYIMNTGTDSLSSVGSTKTGSMLAFSQFYDPLGSGTSFGEAFRQWFVSQYPYSDTAGGYNDISWYYGMTILGDPTLILFQPDTVYVDDDYTPATTGWGWDHFDNLQMGVHKVKGGGQVRVFPGDYEGTVYVNQTCNVIAEAGAAPVINAPEIGAGLIVNSDDTTVIGFKILGNGTDTGMFVRGNNVLLQDFNVTGFTKDIELDHVTNITMAQVEMERGLSIQGSDISHYDSHDIDWTNFVNGGSMHYLVGNDGVGVPTGVGQVILVSCTNISAQDLDLSDTWLPLQLFYSSGCNVGNSTFKDNDRHISVNGDNNYFSDNEFTNSSGPAIEFQSGQDNMVYHNNFYDNNPGLQQVQDDGLNNKFDNGVEGNHWNDWTSPDSDGNGIVDVSYYLAGSSGTGDHFPLTKPWGTPVLVWDHMYNAKEDTFYISQFSVGNTNDPVSWSFQSNTSFLSLHSNGSLMGTPLNEHVGPWWVNISIDSDKGSDIVNFTLDVENTNDAPQIIDKMPTTATEDELFFYVFEAVDIDPTDDLLIWSYESNTSFLTMDAASGNLSGIPENGDVGPCWVNVTVEDNNGASDYLVFSMIVKNANDRPEILTPPVLYCPQGTFYNMTFKAIDPDPTGDELKWMIEMNASNFLNFDYPTGRLSGTPTNDDVGVYYVNVSVNDGNDGADWLYYILKVNNTNDAPINTRIILENKYTEGVSQKVSGEAYDVDMRYGDSLTYSWYLDGVSMGDAQDIEFNLGEGSYLLLLNVTDSYGAWCMNNTLLVVDPAPEIPQGDDDDDNTTVNGTDDDVVDDNVADDDDGKDDKGGSYGLYIFLAALIAVVVLIIIIVLLVVLIKKSAKKDEEDEEDDFDDDYYDDDHDDWDDDDYEEDRYRRAPPPPPSRSSASSIDWENEEEDDEDDWEDDFDDDFNDSDDDDDDFFSLDDDEEDLPPPPREEDDDFFSLDDDDDEWL